MIDKLKCVFLHKIKKGWLFMTKTKRFLSFVVVVMMLVQLFGITGITSVSAASTATQGTTEKDLFSLLEGKGYLAVAADGDGTNDIAIGIKARANENAQNKSAYMLCHDISQVQIDSNSQLVESEALTDVLGKLATGGMSETNARNVITYAKINGKSNYVTNSNDGAYFKTTRTDGVTEKAVWDGVTYYRYRSSSNGGVATYNAQHVTSMGPYFYATSNTFDNETNLTFIIEYFDEGEGSFSLYYHTAAGNKPAGTITKSGTDTWKTAVLSVTDANISSSNSGTGYIHGYDDIRFQGSTHVISRFMVVKTSDYQVALNAPSPVDFSSFEEAGAYLYADSSSDSEIQGGLNILDTTDGYENRMYHIENDLDTINADNGNLKAAYNIAIGSDFKSAIKYVTYNRDGAWKYKTQGTTNAFWTTMNIRYDSRYVVGSPSTFGNVSIGGNMYLRVTDDKVKETDSNVTFIIQYFDNTSSEFAIEYTNTDFANDGFKGNSFPVARTNTNTWKTAVYHITDAKLDKDWTKTGLGDSTASIKIKANNNDLYISKILVIPTVTYNNIVNPLNDTSKFAHNDGINWWKLAKEKGAYVDATEHQKGQGSNMSVFTSTRLYDLNDDTDYQAIGASTLIGGKTVEQIKKDGKYRYITNLNNDGAMKFSTATSGDGITKRTMFSSNHMRNRETGFDNSGYIYYKVDNSSMFTSADDELYILIEYLDYDANIGYKDSNSGTHTYTNQAPFSLLYYSNSGNVKTPTIKKYNTNRWSTLAIPITNAEFTTTNSTGLQTSYDFRIELGSRDLHISRVGIVKASDVGIASNPVAYSAPDTQGAGPTLWITGDSLVENLNTITQYPRTGWGMEIGNYFIKKFEGPLNKNGVSSTVGEFKVANKVTQGVTVINKARGGKSTRSFLGDYDATSNTPFADDGRWASIKANAKKGDYLFFSFGHNDANNRVEVQTNPFSVGDDGSRTSFRANIAEFKAAADEIGLNLVLVTPAATMSIKDGKFNDTSHNAHIETVKAMGRQYGIPVLDVRKNHIALIEALGSENISKVYNYYGASDIEAEAAILEINPSYQITLGARDTTHVNQTGAKELCKIIINEITSKSDQYPSLSQLSQWIDTSKDTTPMAVPVKQNEQITYEIADAKFIVDDVESNTYAPGQVKAKVTVTNASDAERKVVLYTAVYDHTQDLEVASATTPVTLTPGQSTTLTSDALTLPETEGYTFKRFVWDSDMAPYKEDDGKVVLLAEGYNRRAVLTWKTKANLGNVTFKLYRDDELIATTQNYGFIDDGVERGTHKYQLNCYNANGELIYQTAYSVVNVSSIYDVGLDKNVLYTKANVNSFGEADDINCGIKNRATGYIVPSVEAEAHFGTISNADYKKSPYVGSSNTDGDIRRVLVTDSMGISKYAWNTNDYFAKNRGASGAAQNGSIYIDKVDTTDLTVDDTKLTIFVEFLGDVNQLKLQYTSTTVGSNGYYAVKDIIPDQTKISNGEWRVAKYVITDAYCGEGGDGANHPLGDKSPLRFHSGNQDIYISSVMIVKDAQGINPDTIYAKLNNLDYNNRVVRDATSKYADGVSITFEGGQPHGNGMAVYPELSRNSLPDCSGEFGVAEDGTGYYATYDRGSQTNLYVSVDKDYVFGASDRNLVLEVTYKADYDTNLNVVIPRYYKDSDSSSGGNSQTSYPIYKNETDNWQTIKINLDDAGIMGATDNRAIEFRLNIPYVAGRQLKVSRIAVKNADHLPAKYIQ